MDFHQVPHGIRAIAHALIYARLGREISRFSNRDAFDHFWPHLSSSLSFTCTEETQPLNR